MQCFLLVLWLYLGFIGISQQVALFKKCIPDGGYILLSLCNKYVVVYVTNNMFNYSPITCAIILFFAVNTKMLMKMIIIFTNERLTQMSHLKL